jgi:hypothetical protein
LKGQYNHEIVAGIEREVAEDLTVGLTYTRRWLGNIIEDGTVDGTFILANPGNVPQAAIDDAQNAATQLEKVAMAAPAGAEKDRADAAAADARSKVANLKNLKDAPKPERTYNALTLSANKRFSRNWLARASYTYSRLFGNYNGLYDADYDYFAPNGNNAYDTPDLFHNRRGPLANDRPHQARLDGYYTQEVGKGSVIAGLGFSARSGQPRNYNSALFAGQQLIFLLPRGSGGRTPTVTQFDAKLGYRRTLSPTSSVEAFIDFFNILNQRAVLIMDDDYTYDDAAAIVNGTPEDLKFAKNAAGGALTKNLNYGRPLAYQLPFNARLGLRLNF